MPNPYPGRFLELLAETDGPVLDCGSGGRKHPDVISLEYMHQGDADLLADGHHLPFPDNTFTLTLSQAVLEHVIEPQRYVDEIVRTLRPGGLLWIEAAFMQPIHQQPWHFFNITPFGLQHLCRSLEVLDTALLGTYADVVRWMAAEAGVKAPSKIPTPSPDRYFNVASGVALLGRKP
jgi:SAM-dependent methyltransferase